MAITIQEIIASDTMSQVADKINFNFDQLILNGGGAVGPLGPLGPPGPIGGRGERGSDWFEDPNNSATNPNSIIVSPNLIIGDYYLDFNGAVWEYNGTQWNQTTVDLKGPQGTPGLSQGWGYFGKTPNTNVGELSIYLTPMPNANLAASGATQTNQAVPTAVIGAVPTSQANPTGTTIAYNTEYQLNTAMQDGLNSPAVSMLLHSKNSGTKGIAFMGGGNVVDNFEQSDVTKLASISSATDDGLLISVPKASTAPIGSSAALIGFQVDTAPRGQRYTAGKQIQFFTGQLPGGSNDNSNFEIQLAGTAPKYSTAVIGGGTALLEMGSGVSLIPGAAKSGNLFAHANDILINSDNEMKTSSTSTNTVTSVNSNVLINAGVDIKNNSRDFQVDATEFIRLRQLGTGAAVSSIQISSGDPNTITNGVGPITGMLSGADKIAVRAVKDLVMETLDGSIVMSAGIGGGLEDSMTLRAFGGDLTIRANDSLQQSTTPVRTGNIKFRIGPTSSSGGVCTMEIRGGDSSSTSRNTQGQVTIGSAADDNNISGTGQFGISTFRPSLIIDNNIIGNVSQTTTSTIRIGRRAGALGGNVGTNYQKFYGGGEIAGPTGISISTSPRDFERMKIANQISLHVRSSIDSDGVNPGDVWVYTPVAKAAGTSSDFTTAGLHLWGTGTGNIDFCGDVTLNGTTIGLDYERESTANGAGDADNVVGRISLYGERGTNVDSTPGQSEVGNYLGPRNDDTAGDNMGTVNIGDRKRGRQKLKIYGDIGGHLNSIPFYQQTEGTERAPFGFNPTAVPDPSQTASINNDPASNGYTGGRPFWTGPTIQNQQVIAGTTGTFIGDIALNNPIPGRMSNNADIALHYQMHWQRVGMVVQGHGMCQIKTDISGANDDQAGQGGPIPPTDLYEWQTKTQDGFTDPHCIQLGPIPIPCSISSAGGLSDEPISNTGTGGPAENTFGGIGKMAKRSDAQGFNLMYPQLYGQVTGVLHRNNVNASPQVRNSFGTTLGQMTWPNGPSKGYMAPGNATSPHATAYTDGSNIPQHNFMWLCIEIPRAATGKDAFPNSSSATPDYGLAMNKVKFRRSQEGSNNTYVTEGNWMFNFSYMLEPPPTQPYTTVDSCSGGGQKLQKNNN